jgi:uncharacterized protein YcbK (DUF882 family)
MISMNELLSGNKLEEQSQDIQDNLSELLAKVNLVREAWGKPMTVTSGLRTMKHHLEIYAAKGITDKSKIPMQSKHLYGQAADFSDPNNEEKLADIGLWMEDFSATVNWVHFQIVPPKSGHRWFKP